MNAEVRFEALYRDCADQVHAYAMRRASPAAADDVVNETFLVAWRRLDEVPEHALPWLFGGRARSWPTGVALTAAPPRCAGGWRSRSRDTSPPMTSMTTSTGVCARPLPN
jgi:hypothetical protein